MFVTSVEVEKTGWDRKRKKKNRDEYYESLEGGWIDDGNEEVELHYDDAEDPSSNGIDFESAESQWDSFTVVADVSALQKGSLVGWKVSTLASSQLLFSDSRHRSSQSTQ